MTVKPRLVAVGAPVTISGTTFVDGKRLQVGITIQPPDKAPPIKVTATANMTDGTFSTTFKETKTAGEYQVVAVSPDGDGMGKATFRVTTPGGLKTDAMRTLGEALAVSASAVDRAITHTQPLPASPESQEVATNLKAIRDGIAKADQKRDAIGKGLDAVADLASKDPALRQAIEPDFNKLGEWSDTAAQELARIRARLESAPTPVSLCDRIELANEGLTALSLVMSFTARAGAIAGANIGTAHAIFLAVLQNNALPEAVKRLPGTEEGKFYVTEVIKAAILRMQAMGTSDLDFKSTMGRGGIGLLNDLMGYLMTRLYPKYCSKFSGPIKSDFDVSFFHNGIKWMHYHVRLEGQIVLRFRNNTPVGQPIRLTGEIEGNATDFNFDEDVFVLDDDLRRKVVRRRGGLIILRKKLEPEPFVNSVKDPVQLGLFHRMTTPAYFYVGLEGELVNDRIVLKVLDARQDFGDVIKNRLVLIYKTYLLLFPTIRVFEFPIQNAQFILSRGMEHTPDFTIKNVDGKQVVERVFTRKERPGGTTEVQFIVEVKAASPP